MNHGDLVSCSSSESEAEEILVKPKKESNIVEKKPKAEKKPVSIERSADVPPSIQHPDSIAEPKATKPKRPMTDKQRENLAKGREVRDQKRQERRELGITKIQVVQKQKEVADIVLKETQQKIEKNKKKVEKLDKVINKKRKLPDTDGETTSEDDESTAEPSPPPAKKPRKVAAPKLKEVAEKKQVVNPDHRRVVYI